MDNVVQLETLESIIEENKNFALDYFKEKGELRPMIVGYQKQNKAKFILLGDMFESKEKYLTIAKLAFTALDVNQYVSIHEGWAVIGEEDVYKEYKSLADHPKRVEVLNIVAKNRQNAKLVTYKILPDRSLELLHELSGNQVGGTFSELLPPKEVPARLRELLKQELSKYINLDHCIN